MKSALPNWICLAISPELHLREQVVQFFRCHLSDLTDEICGELCTALHELLGNAIEHGCSLNPESGIEFTFIRGSRFVLFQIKDAGPGFSLAEVNHAAVNNPPDDPMKHAEFRKRMGMRPGGFGILLVQNMADELIYNQQGNEVVFIKYLDAPASGHS